MTSFSGCWIKQKEAERRQIEEDIKRFLEAGGTPKIGTPAASAFDYSAKKSQVQWNEERKKRKGLDGKPTGKQIRSVAFVHKRMKNRSATSDST